MGRPRRARDKGKSQWTIRPRRDQPQQPLRDQIEIERRPGRNPEEEGYD